MTAPGERYDPHLSKPGDGAFERPSTESIDLSDHAPNQKISRIQNDLDQTMEVVQDNLRLMQEKDFKTAELEEKSSRLRGASSQFVQSSRRVKRRMWCKDMKWTFILICVILILIVAIVVPVVLKFVPPAQASTSTTTTTVATVAETPTLSLIASVAIPSVPTPAAPSQEGQPFPVHTPPA